jgi:hypothetical protein
MPAIEGNMARRRNCKGSLLADFVSSTYVLFLFLILPLLDFSVVGMRCFFLWFAANQAATAACKAKTYLQPVDNPNQPTASFPSACELAQQRANQIKSILPGMDWSQGDNNPDVQIVREPINPHAENAQPAKVFSRWHGAPLSQLDTPDQSLNIYICRVVIKGKIAPLITMPWPSIPGLSAPLELTVSSQSQFENVQGLVI